MTMYFMPAFCAICTHCFGVEFHRVELLGELLVFLHRNRRVVHDPFADAGNALAVPLAGRNRNKAPNE